MRRLATFLTLVLLAFGARAQQPVSPEQMQQIMMFQMQMMSTMFEMRKSRLGLDETMGALKSSAEKRGWQIGGVHDVQAALKAQGVPDAPPMEVFHTCPQNANERLSKASLGKAPPLPCRITVFEGRDGKINLVKFNTANLAKATQGEVSKVLMELAVEEEAMLKGIVQ